MPRIKNQSDIIPTNERELRSRVNLKIPDRFKKQNETNEVKPAPRKRSNSRSRNGYTKPVMSKSEENHIVSKESKNHINLGTTNRSDSPVSSLNGTLNHKSNGISLHDDQHTVTSTIVTSDLSSNGHSYARDNSPKIAKENSSVINEQINVKPERWFNKSDVWWINYTATILVFSLVYIYYGPQNFNMVVFQPLLNLDHNRILEVMNPYLPVSKRLSAIVSKFADTFLLTAVFTLYACLLTILCIKTSVSKCISVDGIQRSNKCNASRFLIVGLITLIGLAAYTGLIAEINEIVIDNLFGIACSFVVIVTIISVLLFIGQDYAYDCSFVQRFIFGTYFHPTVSVYGSIFNIKFALLNVGSLAWILVLTSVCCARIQLEYNAMHIYACAFMQAAYVFVNWGLFQESLLSSQWLLQDKLGFLFAFVCLVWFPWVTSAPLVDILNINHPLEYQYLLLAVPMYVIGMYILWKANRTKYQFRSLNNKTILASLLTKDSCRTPTKIYTHEGVWSWCRHPNHFATILIHISFTLPFGASGCAYWLPCIGNILWLYARCRAQETSSKRKFTCSYMEYKRRVRFMLVPYLI